MGWSAAKRVRFTAWSLIRLFSGRLQEVCAACLEKQWSASARKMRRHCGSVAEAREKRDGRMVRLELCKHLRLARRPQHPKTLRQRTGASCSLNQYLCFVWSHRVGWRGIEEAITAVCVRACSLTSKVGPGLGLGWEICGRRSRER